MLTSRRRKNTNANDREKSTEPDTKASQNTNLGYMKHISDVDSCQNVETQNYNQKKQI